MVLTNKLVRRVHFFSGVATIITSIFVVIVAGLLGVAILRNNYFKEPDPHSAQGPLVVGGKLAITAFDWTQTERTIVLALNKGCRYCEESASFYKALIKEAAKHKDIRIVALLPQDTETSRKYLSDLEIPLTEVGKADLTQLGVVGTPTVLMVNRNGNITALWVGKLSQESETDVLRSLSLAS